MRVCMPAINMNYVMRDVFIRDVCLERCDSPCGENDEFLVVFNSQSLLISGRFRLSSEKNTNTKQRHPHSFSRPSFISSLPSSITFCPPDCCLCPYLFFNLSHSLPQGEAKLFDLSSVALEISLCKPPGLHTPRLI